MIQLCGMLVYSVTLNFMEEVAFKDDEVGMVTTSVYHVQSEQGDFLTVSELLICRCI